MSALDVKQAKQALAWRLADWGVEDPNGKAASFIDDFVARGWQMSPEREVRPRPPRAGNACLTCGRAMHDPDRLCEQPTRQMTNATPPTDAYLAAKSGLHTTTEPSPEEDEG